MAESNHRLIVTGPRRMPYKEAWAAQNDLREKCVLTEGAENFLMLVEHRPVVTVGRSGGKGDVLLSREALRRRGVELVETNRGGKVTFHGPGQLVMYPIIDLSLRDKDLHRYMRDLEKWLIALCSDYGIEAHRDEGRTGVWVGKNKIAAIGIAARRWVSFHGVALNVTTDLSYFDLIVPCGFTDRGVTSMAEESEQSPALEEVAESAVELFADHFNFKNVERRACVPRIKQKSG